MKLSRSGRTLRLWSMLITLIFSVAGLAFLARSGFAQAQQKVTIAYPTVTPIMAGLWLAKETGAFEQYGLKTDLLFISSGPTTVQAMIGGHVDVSFAASNAVISSILGGAPLVAVGSVSNRPATTLWVQPEITRPEQLEGKLMGVTRLGSASHFLTLMVLEKLGLKEKAKIQPFGGGAEADAAFRAGIVAGRVGSVRPAPQARMMMDVSKLDIAYSMDLMIVKRDFLKNSPTTVENILRGYIDGAVALRANKNKASKVIGKYMRLRPESVGEQTMNENYNDALRSTDVEPRVEPAVIKNVLNWLGKSNVGIDQFFDNTIVDQILREGFIPEAYKRNRSG